MLEQAPIEHESQTERERQEKEWLGEEEPTTDEASAEARHQGDLESAYYNVFAAARYANFIGLSKDDLYGAINEAITWKPRTQKG